MEDARSSQLGGSSPNLVYPSSSSREPSSSLGDTRALFASSLMPSSSTAHREDLQLQQQSPPLTTTDLASFSSQIDQTPSMSLTTTQARSRRQNLGGQQRSIFIPTTDPVEVNQFDHLLSSLGNGSEADFSDKVRVIWGTNIVIRDTVRQFKEFLLNFTMAHLALASNDVARAAPSEQDLLPLYPRLLRRIKDTQLSFLNIDGSHLRAFRDTRVLFEQLLTYPQEIIPLMDMTVNEVFGELFPHEASSFEPIQVRPFNIERHVNLREMSPSQVDQLISVKGLVIRSTSILPDMRTAFFKCVSCDFSQTVDNIKGKVAEPQKCPRTECNALHSMVLQHNRSIFSDKQIVRIQETPDKVPDGQTPHAVTLCLYDTLVDAVRPGDRVEITGIYRVAPIRLNHRQRRLKNLFRTYLDVVHIQLSDRKKVKLSAEYVSEHDLIVGAAVSGADNAADDEDIDAIRALAADPNLYQRLANSLAPSIWQLDTVKKSLLLQLFGGIAKQLKRSDSTRFRGDIHVLLAGDPSVSKSQLLQAVHQLSPRGIYTSGKGSSAVGLTAYITRDPDSGQLVLESGALVLSDGGLCCIDEFDKMADSTRAILHEVMEQQSISVSKAGIITSLNARTSILAAANPIDSKYNPAKSIVENINLPPSLLSRFDIICLILDVPNEANDIQLARHILSLHVTPGEASPAVNTENTVLDAVTFAKYISYARNNIHPVLSEEAVRPLLDGYVDMRKVNHNHSDSSKLANAGRPLKTVSATTRQLESLIRLSEAHARMRLSSSVDPEDVAEAIRLVKSAILSYALDPVTGKIDMDLINTGKGSAFRQKAADLKRHVTALISSRQSARSFEFSYLQKEIGSILGSPVSESLLRQVLQDLLDEDFIQSTGSIRASSVFTKI